MFLFLLEELCFKEEVICLPCEACLWKEKRKMVVGVLVNLKYRFSFLFYEQQFEASLPDCLF